ncbi:hypothetical protein [Tolypothrix sp. VBCCA 56010]|uniref:hypothetical protein n=1 Tax=Tolypothrix sp. VBCCA 56010 TaxID=3137731 RepID=UPI003D7DEFAE
MGHGAWGMGNEEWGMGNAKNAFPIPNAHCPLPNDGRCLNGTAVATTRLTRATRCLGNLRTALPPQCDRAHCPLPIAHCPLPHCPLPQSY